MNILMLIFCMFKEDQVTICFSILANTICPKRNQLKSLWKHRTFS